MSYHGSSKLKLFLPLSFFRGEWVEHIPFLVCFNNEFIIGLLKMWQNVTNQKHTNSNLTGHFCVPTDIWPRPNTLRNTVCQSVLPSGVNSLVHGGFMQNGVLLRQMVSHGEGFVGYPLHQIVVQSIFSSLVLGISHDEWGHMGVGKTLYRHLFWSCMRKSVSGYMKAYHT